MSTSKPLYYGVNGVAYGSDIDNAPSEASRLTARFHYDPSLPDEPEGGQGNVDTDPTVEATALMLNIDRVTIATGEKIKLSATPLPENATYRRIYWITSAPQVAAVTQNGDVTGRSPGEAVITATDGRISVSCTITVEQAYTPGDVNGDGAITVGDITLTVAYILGNRPANMILEAADLNGDGSVTVTDITRLVNIILTR